MFKRVGILGSLHLYKYEKHIDRYLKNGVSEGIVHVIKHVDSQLYRVHPDGAI